MYFSLKLIVNCNKHERCAKRVKYIKTKKATLLTLPDLFENWKKHLIGKTLRCEKNPLVRLEMKIRFGILVKVFFPPKTTFETVSN